MEANTGNEETAGMEGSVSLEKRSSSWGETAAVGRQGSSDVGGTVPRLNPLAASFTPLSQAVTDAGPTSPASDDPTVRPAGPRPPTPPSLECFARELRELKSNKLSNKQHLSVMQDQRRQLLSHMTTAKAEIDRLEDQLQREESIEGCQEIVNRLKELNGLHEWVGYKWTALGEEMADLEAVIAMAGSGEDEFWGL